MRLTTDDQAICFKTFDITEENDFENSIKVSLKGTEIVVTNHKRLVTRNQSVKPAVSNIRYLAFGFLTLDLVDATKYVLLIGVLTPSSNKPMVCQLQMYQ